MRAGCEHSGEHHSRAREDSPEREQHRTPFPLSRREEVTAAAIVISKRMSAPIKGLPCNSKASTNSTETI